MDLATAQTHLAAWLAADTALTSGQSYAIGELSLTRADARHVRDQITYWQRIVDRLTAEAAGAVQGACSFAQFA